MHQADVPRPIDFQQMCDAREWESNAMERPFRLEMFQAIADSVSELDAHRILELGSGPGFLAEHLLSRLPDISISLLDFSKPMHDLAKIRLAKFSSAVQFIERNFKESSWVTDLEQYDAIITNQAVHELRHKRYAGALHKQVKCLLRTGGIYLVCDHFFGEGAMKNCQLYMTVDEQAQALKSAGFRVKELLRKGSLVLHRAS